MKQLPDKYYNNLTSHQRFVATWEAIGRGDEAEKKRLMDTAPSFSYFAADHAIRHSWDAVLAISLGIEADIRGCALTILMAQLNGDTETSISKLITLKTFDAKWRDILKEIGLSDAAIIEARVAPHPYVEHLLALAYKHEPGSDPGLDDYFEEVRRMIPLLNGK